MASDGMSFIAMVLVQVGYAGMNIISKLAMDSGMNPYILITYRQIFSTLAIIPFAFFLERKTRPNMTMSIFFQIFLCSIFGATANQILYFVGLNISTPTIACALSNLLPAMTFVLAVPFRLENVGIKSMAGQAKVFGTVICVGGAMLLSFYNGSIIRIHESSIHWKYAEEMTKSQSEQNLNILLGSVLLILSTGAWAIWFIIQARLSEKFNAPYTSSAMMCSMASIECALIGIYSDHHIDAWSLRSSIRLITTLYAGLSSALAFCLMSWCIQRKGPLYVSVFSPLLLVLVAVLSWALLQETIHIGTVVGSVLIVLGLYGVLWGKKNEINATDVVKDEENGEKVVAEKDLELQFFDIIGSDLHVMTGK